MNHLTHLKLLMKRVKKIQLEQAEREAARRLLHSYIEKEGGVPFLESSPETRRGRLSFFLNLRYSLAALAGIAVLLSGSVAVGAEKAKPGDVLYPVKIKVNEEIRSLVATGSEDKALWEGRRAIRRLEEVEHVELRGEASAEVGEELGERFVVHVNKVKIYVEKLKGEGKAEEAVRVLEEVEISLRAHDALLGRIRAMKQGQNALGISVKKATTIAIDVDPAISLIEKLRVENEARLNQRAEEELRGIETLQKAAEAKIEKAKEVFETKEEILGQESRGEIEAELEAAEELFIQAAIEAEQSAEEKISDTERRAAENKAADLLRDSKRKAAEIETRIEAELKIGL